MSFLSSALARIIALGFSADLILFFVIFLSGFVYTAFLGRRRVLLYLTSVYVALAVLAYAPFLGRIPEVISSTSKIIYFIVAFLILFFILSRGVLGQVFKRGGYISGWWQVLFLSFFQLALIVSIVFSFLPGASLNIFSLFTRIIFLDPWGRFILLIIPIILMAALARKDDKD
ncbi:MAG: hypothetical protein UT86_C0001G0085 [Candidatus Magasanikbacteria bacterium GW2011_GWC2_40_17]|uniref:CvpA family protein n=1 Tax=Candidatus Magasanikbacteria bacterium GW2011_GWA2_42_32 TaxID=1619039 RepID=A0A0G1A8U0_9BACT|nr:MAG: hypothetical protein UT86_C0001G0085 [Candidatus Magasanikbacteria bacterium GW2011_GWC2_40_17]KKS57445.1 MAG: hypothetical protein UV20_C0001G0085 [Candidatus Magasanikbacteria bacterium GW2011_GWA2_42_32]OGH85562.1 MAG: hypothetical protein A2294_01630 [Candidatus Magasanikbacteria bacterium RIFOXYB2_FULL_38_10]